MRRRGGKRKKSGFDVYDLDMGYPPGNFPRSSSSLPMVLAWEFLLFFIPARPTPIRDDLGALLLSCKNVSLSVAIGQDNMEEVVNLEKFSVPGRENWEGLLEGREGHSLTLGEVSPTWCFKCGLRSLLMELLPWCSGGQGGRARGA